MGLGRSAVFFRSFLLELLTSGRGCRPSRIGICEHLFRFEKLANRLSKLAGFLLALGSRYHLTNRTRDVRHTSELEEGAGARLFSSLLSVDWSAFLISWAYYFVYSWAKLTVNSIKGFLQHLALVPTAD